LATSSSNRDRTIWTLALVAVVVFLAWKLWPALKKLLNGASGSGSGGGSGAVGGAANPYPFYENPSGQGNSGSGNFGFGAGSGGGAAAGSQAALDPISAFTDWLQVVLSNGLDDAALAPSELGYNPNNGMDELQQLDEQGIQSSAFQNFDVNELAYSPSSAGTNSSAYLPPPDTISVDGGLRSSGGDGGGNEGGDGGDDGGGGGGGY